MDKITNLELTKRRGDFGFIESMDLAEEVVKTKATHSWANTIRIFNEKHPKPTGKSWNKRNFQIAIRNYQKRVKDVAACSTSVCDAVSSTVTNTAKGIDKLNSLLNNWLDSIDATRTVRCPDCDAEVKVFDTDKAVRVCAEIRRTLVTAHQMSGSLPNVEQTSETVGKAVEFTQMLDKMVQDGTIIIVSKDKPISEQVAHALGEKPKKPVERAIKISIDEDESERDQS